MPTRRAKRLIGLVAVPIAGVAIILTQPRSGRTPDITGVLTNDMVSIGGETTGWMITLPSGAPKLDWTPERMIEVNVSGVAPQAAKLAGKNVNAWGSPAPRTGVERKTYSVFVITRLE